MKNLYPGIAAISLMFMSTNTLSAPRPHVCDSSSRGMRDACNAELRDDRSIGYVICSNVMDANEQSSCFRDVRQNYAEGNDLCRQQFRARLDLCDELGQQAYDVREFWQAENFVDQDIAGGSDRIGVVVPPNPWFNLTAGTEYTFFGAGETIQVTVSDETKLIEGVRCRTVTDLVTEDGLNVEDTDDWYAQDVDGNVWYCGEIALNYEFFEGDDPEAAELTDIEGSWKAFRDGAQPGIVFFTDPEVGLTYRQEVAWGDAEDVAKTLTVTADGLLEGDECENAAITAAVNAHVADTCDNNCLVTLEYTPIAPDVTAHKYYAPGVGLLAEVEDGACTATQGVIDEGDGA